MDKMKKMERKWKRPILENMEIVDSFTKIVHETTVWTGMGQCDKGKNC